MRKMIAMFATGLGLFLVVDSQARAGVVLTFDSPNFEWHHPAGHASRSYIWNLGDYWAQNFTGTGLASADSMDLHLNYDHNTLGQSLNMKVLLNGDAVWMFDIKPGESGYAATFSFSAISGPDFRIQLEAMNTIADGQGGASLSLGNSGATLTSAVPEPTAIALAGSALGIGAVVGLRRRATQRRDARGR